MSHLEYARYKKSDVVCFVPNYRGDCNLLEIEDKHAIQAVIGPNAYELTSNIWGGVDLKSLAASDFTPNSKRAKENLDYYKEEIEEEIKAAKKVKHPDVSVFIKAQRGKP